MSDTTPSEAQASDPGPAESGEPDYREWITAPPPATDKARPDLSAVGVRTAGGLACPRCGGAQFKTKRSVKWKAGLAGGAALTALSAGAFAPVLIASAATAKPKWVVCVTCGEVYNRG